MEPDREELKNLIEQRTWMVNDARLFTWAKCAGRLKQLEGIGIGGGNFLMVLGLFSVLNFLSKVYYLLHDDGAVWTSDEVRAVKRAIRGCPDANGATPPLVGTPKKSELNCFIGKNKV